jgi:hypothetical protein
MYAYCWASGLIQFGRTVPPGSLKIAHGPVKPLQETIGVLARHGKGDSAGKLLVPGVPDAPDDRAKADALAAWLAWCAERRYAGITFSRMEA